MRVIVQDSTTKEFISSNGQWTSDRNDARDFVTLPQAYYFARRGVATHFQVMLYCPDANYTARVINGVGVAGVSRVMTNVPLKVVEPVNCQPVRVRFQREVEFPIRIEHRQLNLK